MKDEAKAKASGAQSMAEAPGSWCLRYTRWYVSRREIIKRAAYTRVVPTAATVSTSALALLNAAGASPELEQAFLAALPSPHSRAAYLRSIAAFSDWAKQAAPGLVLSRSIVLAYRESCSLSGVSTATTNLRLAAIRHLAREAEALGLLAPAERASILTVKGVKMRGVRSGNWLTGRQTDAVLSRPDRSTLKGARDFAILALLFSCGLRRAELASIRLDQIAEREERMVLLDLVGKGNRMRTIPVPGIARDAIELWLERSGLTEGRLFRAVNKAAKLQGEGLSPEAILQIVQRYATEAGFPALRPHDARRTCAKLCRKAEGRLEDIQHLLGHASVLTTMRYLGNDQQLKHSVNDRLVFQPR